MSETTTYTEKELKGMSRVLLRRAAREVLGIDNKEASNSKSADLIGRILEAQEGGGNGEPPKQTRSRGGKSGGSKTTSGRSGKGKAKEEPAGDGIEAMVNAVGKGVDENHAEVKELLETVLENQAEIQRQNFILFGLATDIYKAVDEPDALEERLKELEEEWEAQGNED